MKISEYKYKCDKCDKMFYLIGDYKRHINRKNPCKILPPKPPISNNSMENLPPKPPILPPILYPNLSAINDNVLQDANKIYDKHENVKHDTILECHSCGKTFTRKDNLNRHLVNRCKKKLREETDTIQELRNKILFMEQKMFEITDKTNQINIGNNNNNNNNIKNIANNQYDIKIIAFGEENLYNRIGDDLAKKFISKGYQSVLHLIDYVHFNKDHPELQNVFISNKKNDVAQVFNGSYWEDRPKKDVIEQMFDDKQCFLLDMYNELKPTLPPNARAKFERFMNEDNAEIINGLKREIKLYLYNKKNIPMDTKKLIDSNKLKTIL